jgi:RNA polymerase sigma factor (sigma-70 family)
MATAQLDHLLQHLRKLVRRPAAADVSDGQLLERFAGGREEAAFEALLQRHAALVWGVCRRLLHDVHDAEDAFQATFLVLAHRAGSIRKLPSVGSWLYGVAYRVALRSRTSTQRRRRHERQAEPMPSTDPLSTLARRELRTVLDEELSRLPERYRAPVVLCDLEGKTHQEAARELGQPAGSMSRRLARGRELLRQRLAGRGVLLSGSVLLTALAEQSVAAPPALLTATLRAVTLSAAGQAVLCPQAATLAEGTLKAMAPARLQIAVRLLLVVSVLAAGAGLLPNPRAGSKPPQANPTARPNPAPRPPRKPNTADEPLTVKAIKERLLRRHGGTARTEAAVAAGLQWLVRHQQPDGRWSFENLGKCNCGGKGTHKNDVAATAFGLLPFLGAGYTHRAAADNPYHRTVLAGLSFLQRQQKKNGDFGGGMYAQGLATIALCEDYGLTQDRLFKATAQAAVNYIVKAEHPSGSWRYTPGEPGDTSITGWQVSALISAQNAGLEVPAISLQRVERFLDHVMDRRQTGGHGYTGPGDGPGTTAIGLLCRQKLQGWGPANPGLARGVNNILLPNLPERVRNTYFSHYATQVLHLFGGRAWERWNASMRHRFVGTQDDGTTPQHAHQQGSWDPAGDAWGQVGGRLMITSLTLLQLEVYYRSDLLLAKQPARPLTAKELEVAWADLAGAGGFKVRQEIWQLVRAHQQTIPFLRERLQPAKAGVDAERVARLIADLNNERFKVRDQASKELEKLGEAAEPALRRAARGKPPVETLKRLERLLGKLDQLAVAPERMRQSRALEILEHIGNAQARQVLQALAGGTAGAWLTEEARAALERLGSKR